MAHRIGGGHVANRHVIFVEMRWGLLVVLSACWSSRQPIETSEPVPNDVAGLDDRFAIVEVTPAFVECDGAKHFVLETRDRKPVRHVRAGYDVKVGEVYVAEVLREDPIDCYSDFDGNALNLVRAYDLQDARALIEGVRRNGMARTITIRDHDGHETVGIGRVIATKGLEVRLDPIVGDVPVRIDLPFFEKPVLQVGDPVVVASSHAEPTRVLVTRTLRAARKWVDAIEHDGWPRDVIEISADR